MNVVTEIWMGANAMPVRRFSVKALSPMDAVLAVPVNVGEPWDSFTPMRCREIVARQVSQEYFSVDCRFDGPSQMWVYPPITDDDSRLPLLGETVRERYTLRPAPPAWVGVLGLIALGCLLAWVMQ
jgi:hypothetical protein